MGTTVRARMRTRVTGVAPQDMARGIWWMKPGSTVRHLGALARYCTMGSGMPMPWRKSGSRGGSGSA